MLPWQVEYIARCDEWAAEYSCVVAATALKSRAHTPASDLQHRFSPYLFTLAHEAFEKPLTERSFFVFRKLLLLEVRT